MVNVSIGSYICVYDTEYTGDGMACTDNDEYNVGSDVVCDVNGYEASTDGTDACDANASGTHAVGPYTCSCNVVFSGDGFSCTDIDEYLTTTCDTNAAYANTSGSITCTCYGAYYGDGFSCIYYNNIQMNTGGTLPLLTHALLTIPKFNSHVLELAFQLKLTVASLSIPMLTALK